MRLGLLILAAALAAGAVPAAGAAPATEPALQVHLPRRVQVEADSLVLGAVAVVHAADDTLARRAAAVPLGRAPWKGEEITLDRPTLLGRLASHGIPATGVVLSGADRVVVARGEQTLAAEAIVREAETLVARERPAPAGAAWRVLRGLADAIVPAGGARLAARLLPHEIAGEAKVEVAVHVGDRPVATQMVVLRLAYACRETVAAVDLPAGALVTPDNTEVRVVSGDLPAPADWAPPYGLVTVQPVRAGTVLRPSLVRRPQAQAVVQRNQSVVMRVRRPGFVVTAVGQALEDGRPGDFIKVRNVDSLRIVAARVMPDGSVEPALEEVNR